MKLGHLLTRSGLKNPEVSSKVYLDSFCQLENIVSLPWVIYYVAFYLHVVSSSSCIPVLCPRLVLFLIPLQFVYLAGPQAKGSNHNLDLSYSGPVTHSGEILTTSKSHELCGLR
jgi:hypothetical protein